MTQTKRKSLIMGGLFAVVIVMAIGYAAFATRLNITGTSNISSSWKIKIVSVEADTENAVSASHVSSNVTNDLTANFSCNLTLPGVSTIDYKITVKNEGSVDAVLKDINLSESTNPAVTFTRSGIKRADVLRSGESKTFTITVAYSDDVTEQPESLTASASVTLEYVQDGTEGIVPEIDSGVDYITSLAATDSTLITDDYGNIRYSGKNVNNYVCMDSTETTCSDANLYRIIGVFKNIKTTASGTGETRIKLIKATNNGNAYWNNSNGYSSVNNWAEASLKNTLNSASTPIYSSSLIDDAVWNIGGHNTTAVTTSQMYNYERGTTVYCSDANDNTTCNPTTWIGKIALMYPSDYGYASSACYSTKNLGGGSPDYRDSDCTGSNWLFLSSVEWLLTPSASSSRIAFIVNSTGLVDYYADVFYHSLVVRPAVYLKSDVEIVADADHDGSQSKPYLLQ